MGGSVVFYAEASHNSSVEDFQFEISSDGGSTWATLFTVTDPTDTIYSAGVGSVSGNVIVRFLDTDRSRGENVADSLFVDQMYFESSSARSYFVADSSSSDDRKADEGRSKSDLNPALSIELTEQAKLDSSQFSRRAFLDRYFDLIDADEFDFDNQKQDQSKRLTRMTDIAFSVDFNLG